MRKEKPLPCFEISSDELEKKHHLFGEKATCPRCKKDHLIRYGTDTRTGKESKTLVFVICKNNMSYLIAINGKKL